MADKLWIAFELYLWNIEHSGRRKRNFNLSVVNWFWILSLKYWAQLASCGLTCRRSCELLLNCIFEILSTACQIFINPIGLLWIAFELYLWNIEHSFIVTKPSELLLWIAFELYLWNIEHSKQVKTIDTYCVVNCFWIVSLKYWAQQVKTLQVRLQVVNCFWIVSLKYWAQRIRHHEVVIYCCELLLNCIFEILSTALRLSHSQGCQLWIAFELYLWNIEHSNIWTSCNAWRVVNCFWIVSLKYWAQQA